MVKITAIKQQVKRDDRYSIYLDGKYSFSLSQTELAKLALKEDQEVDRRELTQLICKAEIDKAYDRSLRYIAIRTRSLFEIETYLQRKGYDKKLIATITQKLQQIELIDDKKFAQQWLQWRLSSGRSRRHIQAELRQKHVDQEIIAETLSQVDETTELEQLKALIERKTKLSQYQDKQKLIGYFARKGYSYGLIKQALEG